MAKKLHGALAHWCSDESGVTAIEYGLLAALIVVACIGAFSLLGTNMTGLYTAWTTAVVAAL
jgi:pilus assembly protein Flp/PilA